MIVNVKHSVLSIAGVFFSQIANFVAIILIGKFCGPSELGYFSQLTAIGLFAGSLLGLRLEVACMATDRKLAVQALVSSSSVATTIALLLAGAAVVSGHTAYASAVMLAEGVFLQQALSQAMASDRKYASIAVQRAFPNVAFAVLFIVLVNVSKHTWSGSEVFAVYSFLFFASSVLPLLSYLFDSRSMLSWECLRFSRLQLDYAKFSLPATSLQSVVIYSIAILMPIAFAPHDAGVVALAYRVGYFPASLLGQSLGPVFRRDLIDFVGTGSAGNGRNPAISFSIILMPLSLALLIIGYKMGDLWQPSMHVYLLFTPYFLTMAMFGSLAQVFIVFRRQKFDVMIQMMNAAGILLIFAATAVIKLDLMLVVLLLSVSGTLVASMGIYYSYAVARGGMNLARVSTQLPKTREG
jgi:O-antigen/teichoic acid export membrane protein